MSFSKKIQVLMIASSLTFIPVISLANAPAYYHYNYVYPDFMKWCGKLVQEIFANTNKNWHFTKKKLTKITAAFPIDNERVFFKMFS